MIKRLVMGERNNGDIGIFVSPPGVDADTAADSALVLNVTSKVSQLILLGVVDPTGDTIPLGLGQKPFVFVTSQWNFVGVAGHTLGQGPTRPSPMIGASTSSSATVYDNGSYMVVSAPSYRTNYAVYSAAFS